jgi:hypothetical protein
MKKYGFTGTRTGLNENQIDQIQKLLQSDLDAGLQIEVHHGDCVGADADFHAICQKLSKDIKIVIHPGCSKQNSSNHDSKLRAYCKSDDIQPAKDYLDRNRDIVNETSILIACPFSNVEQQRSGTWYTIRYARKVAKPIILFV